jgi:predicted ArsR family transcriptional regulator
VTVLDRAAQRAAYRAAWRSRLLTVLTLEWRSSHEIAEQLGETNAKVLERLRDLVEEGIVQRRVIKQRQASRPGPFRAFFRLSAAVGSAP